MLRDGVKSDKYIAILGNLKEGGFLTSEEVNVLISGYISKHIIVLDSISDEKARIVSEALIDNYNRLKSK
ncbi:hypothetical protein [Pricia sp.]|uniref:hypothetical protein n=1 Tax=Pricia sp. TaxID=2268138 RepID=UPI003593B854